MGAMFCYAECMQKPAYAEGFIPTITVNRSDLIFNSVHLFNLLSVKVDAYEKFDTGTYPICSIIENQLTTSMYKRTCM